MVLSLIILTISQFYLLPSTFRAWVSGLFHENAILLREYIIIISGGIFTSTFLTLSITIQEYKDVRFSTLENYYIVSNNFLNNFRKIQYLYLDYPYDIVQNCFREESANNVLEQMDESIKKLEGKINKKMCMRTDDLSDFEAKEKMKYCIWNSMDEEIQKKFDDTEIRNQFLEERYREVMQDYITKINAIMKQYIEIKNCNYDIVETAFGKIDFIFFNKKIRKKFIYEKLHDRQRSVLNLIVKEAGHFEEYYKRKNGNLAVLFDKITKIQDKLFQMKKTERGNIIYRSFYYEMDEQLFELWKLIYGNRDGKEAPNFKEYAVFFKVNMKKFKDVKTRAN